MKKSNVFLLIWPYIWTKQSFKQKLKFLLYIFATIITTGLVISVPLLLKYTILVLDSKENIFNFTPISIVIAYGITWTLTKVIDRLRHQSSFPIITNIIQELCLELFSHLQNLSMRYHNDKKSGKVFNTISRTRYAIAGFSQSIGQEIIPILMQIVSASILLTYYYGFRYGSVLIIMLFLYLTLSKITAKKIVKERQKQNQSDGDASAFIVDSLLNAETVKYFGMEKEEEKKAKILLKRKQEADISSLMSDAKIHLMQNFIIGVSIIFLSFMSGFEVFNETLHVSDFVMINSFILMFMSPLSSLGYRYRDAKLQITHLESTFEILQEPIEIKDSRIAKNLEFKQGEIEFKNVKFSYKKERQILKDLSFKIIPNKTTAIVGTSGSGKSTISKLIFRLYDIDDGYITIDGQDIKNLKHSSICNNIGIVPQDTVMFNDTIENNILYSSENSSTNINDIIKSVELEDMIKSLPKGIKTLVGERGLKLSGGERQRLAIARVLARNPKILIFDEATSALDFKTEKKIQKCLMNISKGVTTIIIAHRLSTIKHADNIIVLDDGIIKEQGTHDDLLRKNGVYSKLLMSQE